MNEYCQHCPRRYDNYPGKPGACRSDGDLNAKILLVGMSPGEHELNNVPFVGAAGAVLWGTGRGVGLSRADVRIMNTSNCWPCGSKGKTLSDAQIGACWNRFNEEMLESKAEVVVCLGGDALTRVTGLHKIDRYRGYLFSPDMLKNQEVPLPVLGEYKTSRKCDECKGVGQTDTGLTLCVTCEGFGYKYRKGDKRLLRTKVEVEPVLPPNCKWVIATYHPSYIMRKGRKPLRAFINDLHRAVRASRNELEIKERHWSDSPIEIARTDNLVAFDIENIGGLDGAIERIGFSGATGTWTAPWDHASKEAARYELGDPDRIKVAHNIQHDLRHLEAEGVEVPGTIFDTMWAGMILEPDLPMGLRSMAPLWLDLHGCWKDDMRALPEYYNAMDAAIEHDLAQALILRHHDLGSYEPLMKFVMPSLRVLLDMHRTGLHVDLPWLGMWSKKLADRRRVLEKVWHDDCPIECDIASPLKVQGLLYGYLGLDVVKDPDNGFKPTTAAWACRLLMTKYPNYHHLLRCLLAYRKIEKLIDCCSLSLGADGAVHPHFGPHWKDEPSEGSKRKGTTSTLRLSVAADGGLNLQQIPKMARRMYVAPKGYTFLEVDLDRAEPWVYAVRSNDTKLIYELEHGDPYLRVAEQAGCGRDTAKVLFLARMYGAREKKGNIILAKAGIASTPQTVKDVFASMANLYPRVERYREKIGQDAMKNGRLVSGFGFVREFRGGESDIPEAMDWEAQHHVAVTLLSTLVPLHQMAKSFGGWLALTVYDSAMLCVPTEQATAAGKAMLDVMTAERPEIAAGFRPRASVVKQGTNWRDLV